MKLSNFLHINKLGYLFLVTLMSISCSDNDSPEGRDLSYLKTCENNQSCDDCVVIDAALHKDTSTENYRIEAVRLEEDCLEVTFSSSGCSGSSWEVELIDGGIIAESYPVQRFARLRLKNEELCLAWITKTVSFNLTPLQVEPDRLYLNLEGWAGQILYEY